MSKWDKKRNLQNERDIKDPSEMYGSYLDLQFEQTNFKKTIYQVIMEKFQHYWIFHDKKYY